MVTEIRWKCDDDFDTVERSVKNVGGVFTVHFIALVIGLAMWSMHHRNLNCRSYDESITLTYVQHFFKLCGSCYTTIGTYINAFFKVCFGH